jgi:nucleoside-diphosphate-sugar epimerase
MSGLLIAVTGATGFIGRALLADLPRRGYRVRALLRRPADLPPEATSAVIGDIAAPRHMSAALAGVDIVVHSAGLAHAMSGRPEDDYRALNTDATLALARAAAKAGAKRFVFLSSIRAQSGPVADYVLSEADPARPTDAYGRSKLAAEEGLAQLGIDWVALRPVLVHGPGVKGNMAALLRLAAKPWPLPLGGFAGKRSLVSSDSVMAAIACVLAVPESLNRSLIVADPDPVTVGEIIAALRSGLGRKAGLVAIPPVLMRRLAQLAGQSEAYERLAGSLMADAGALAALGWRPPLPTRDALARLAAGSVGT